MWPLLGLHPLVVAPGLRVLRVSQVVLEMLRFFELAQDEVILSQGDTRIVDVLRIVRNTVLLLLEEIELDILLRL